MALWAGLRWRNGVPEEAWVRTRGSRVVDEGEGAPPGPAEPVVLLDGLIDYHTHVGDAFLEGERLPRQLEALVAPGSGFKHRRLAQTSPTRLRAAAERHLGSLARNGIVEALDFREQGLEGIRWAQAAAQRVPDLRLRLLGRPADDGPDSTQLPALLRAADGIGIPSLSDWGLPRCRALAEAAHRGRKSVALHVSEAQREPIEDVLSLEPDLLVHACAATDRDLRRIHDAGVPLALCPTSNAFFGLRPRADRLESLGVAWHLGTDNALLGAHDLVAEARRLRSWFPKLPDASLLRALTTRPEKVINRIDRFLPRVPPASRLVALARDPHGRVRWRSPPRLLHR